MRSLSACSRSFCRNRGVLQALTDADDKGATGCAALCRRQVMTSSMVLVTKEMKN